MTFTDQYTDQYGRIWMLYRDERPDRYMRLMYATTPTDITVTVTSYKKDAEAKPHDHPHKDDYPVHVNIVWDTYTLAFQSRKSSYRRTVFEFANLISQNLEHKLPDDWSPDFIQISYETPSI